MAETQKVQEQRQPKPPPKSWWQWATRSDQQQQGEEQEKGEEEPLITQEDIQIIMDSVQARLFVIQSGTQGNYT